MPTAFRLLDTELLSHLTPLPATATRPTPGTMRWQGPNGVGLLDFTEYRLPGVTITDIQGTLHRPLEMQLFEHQACIGQVYQIKGCSEATMEKQRRFRVEQQHDNMLYEPSADVCQQFIPAGGGAFHAVSLSFEPTYFTSLIQENAAWLPIYQQLLPQQRPVSLFGNSIPTAPQVMTLLEQLRHGPAYTGQLRKMYLEARFLDLFVAQQDHYLNQQAAPLRRRDRDMLQGVRQHLDQHYADAPTIRELARLFGTNDCTLKKGFKELFGTTVFDYVTQKRLQEAYLLLTHTEQSVQDVAAAVGYGNPAHFATAFKRCFGLTPLKARRVRGVLAKLN